LNLEPPTVDDRAIWDLWLSQYPLAVVVAADELGLFSFVDAQPSDLQRVSDHFSLTSRGAEALLATLAACGYLVKHSSEFHLTDVARTYLLPDRDFYWVPMLRNVGSGGAAAEGLIARLRSDNLGSNDRVTVRWEHGGISPEDARSSNRSFHSHSFPAAVGMARGIDFGSVRRLLDVAGGPGSFSIALALRYPALKCTIADLPNVVTDTRSYIERYHCQDRVDTHAFNMFEETWPAGYDAIFFSNVYHDWDANRRTDLTARAFAALPSGGRILVHEMLLSDAADGPLHAALFSVMMLGTRGKQFSFTELADMLSCAGFVDVSVAHSYAYYSLISGTKP